MSIDCSNSTTKTILTGVPQGSVLGPLLFLVYINDLHNCMKHSKVFHFADDTSVLRNNKSLKDLAKQINSDLKNLSQWLKANKLSLNVNKTELVVFRKKEKLIDHTIKFKLNGKRLIPSDSVKYLGLFLDEHLSWTKQLSHVFLKLNRAIGILSKLRHNTNLNILKIVYHSLFGSHLLYGCQLWGQQIGENQQKIQKLQNRALRKITFKKMHESAKAIHKELKILKFSDNVYMQNCLFMSQIEHDEKLAKSFVELKHCGDNHTYETRSKTNRLLDVPFFNTDAYGTHSSKYHCIIDWNDFRRTFSSLLSTEFTYFNVKRLLKERFLNSY